MSLDNIQLTPILWQNLYKHALIQEKKIQASDPIANANTIPFLGNNKKMITLLVHDEEAIYLSDASLKFLLGILSACKLSMDDIALVNLSKNNGITHDLIPGIGKGSCSYGQVPVHGNVTALCCCLS